MQLAPDTVDQAAAWYQREAARYVVIGQDHLAQAELMAAGTGTIPANPRGPHAARPDRRGRPAAPPGRPAMTPSPSLVTRHGAFVAAAITYFRSPRMEHIDVRFALVREPTNPLAKPTAYDTISDLARAIHVERGDAAIELEDRAPLNIRDWGEVLGVAVWALDESGARQRYIGWAWLAGGGRRQLEAALQARHSVAPTIGVGRQGRAA